MNENEDLVTPEFIECFVARMKRRERARWLLLSLFLVNGLAAVAFGAYVWLTRDLGVMQVSPALALNLVSLSLLAILWSRTQRRRKMLAARAQPGSVFLRHALEGTERAIHERRWIMGSAAGLLTPLFVAALWTARRSGAMSDMDALSLAGLWGASLLVLIGVSVHALRNELNPRARRLKELLRQLEP